MEHNLRGLGIGTGDVILVDGVDGVGVKVSDTLMQVSTKVQEWGVWTWVLEQFKEILEN